MGLSFVTKERLAAWTKDGRKCRLYEKKTHFARFLAAVLRTHCWAHFDLRDSKQLVLLYQETLILDAQQVIEEKPNIARGTKMSGLHLFRIIP